MAEREQTAEVGRRRIVTLAVINGLVSEIELVRSALDRHRPEAVGIQATAVQIESMRKWNASEEQETEFSDFDILYIREMSKFGDIHFPSPAKLFALTAADATGIAAVTLDIEDDAYSDLYMKHVSPYRLFVDSFSRRRRMKKSFEGSAEEVVLRLDEVAMHPRGMEKVEREREKRIGEQILSLSAPFSVFLAVIDYERAEGVRKTMVNSTV